MMKISTQNSSNRRSKKESHPQIQSKRKPDKTIAKSLTFADPNSPDEELSEVYDSPESTESFGFTPESTEKTEYISSNSTQTNESTPESADKTETVTLENSPTSAMDSTMTFVSPGSGPLDDVDKHELISVSVDGKLTQDVEAQMLVDYLGQARYQVANATTVDCLSKRIFDAVIKIVMEEYFGVPRGDKPRSQGGLIWLKVRIGFLCFFMWIILVAVVLLNKFRLETRFPGPCPT